MRNSQLYERDFYAWANEQAALLRAGRLSEADIEHIAEEIDSMGRHLLKWQFQPGLRSNNWRNTIRAQRISLASHMKDNPSLKAVLDEAISESYRIARLQAESETGLPEDTFPPACPWSFEQIIADDFWPGEAA